MKKYHILLKSISDVKHFVSSVSKYDFEADLSEGRYVVDAKSIMGIFSLDLSKALELTIHGDDCETFLEEIKPFIQE